MNERITKLKDAIHRLHKCKADHLGSVPVKETLGHADFDGVVEVFSLKGTQKADACYAWITSDGRVNVVLRVPPVDSPIAAVRAVIVE